MKRSIVSILLLAVAAQAMVLSACSSSPSDIDLGPTPTAVAPAALEPLRGFEGTDELFEAQLLVSRAEVRKHVDDGADDEVIDFAIRREGGRLIRVIWEVVVDDARKFEAFRLECECTPFPNNFSHWIDEKLAVTDAFVRDEESAHLSTSRPRHFSNLDDVRTALAPFIVELTREDYSQRPGYLSMFMSNLFVDDPVANESVTTEIVADPRDLRVRSSLWLTEDVEWRLNVGALSLPLTEFEAERPASEKDLLRAFITALVEHDHARFHQSRHVETSRLYEFAATVLAVTPGLSQSERVSFEDAASELFLRNESEVIAAVILELRRAGVDAEAMKQVANILQGGELFEDEDPSHVAVVHLAEELSMYLSVTEGTRDSSIAESVLSTVGSVAVRKALDGALHRVLIDEVLANTVEREIAAGLITERTGTPGQYEFSHRSFLHDQDNLSAERIYAELEAHPDLLRNPRGEH